MKRLKNFLKYFLYIGFLFVLSFFLVFGQTKKVFKRGNGAEPATLDPHFASGTWENYIIGDMFMGLVTESADGKLLPGLASSWKISSDGLTYTFSLRPNIVWSDGKPITSQDFVYSLRRILNPKTAAKYAFILYSIKNAQSINKGETPVNKLGVQAVNKSTLKITLESPTPFFMEQLTHYTSWAVPKHVVEKYGNDWTKKKNIAVSGPFILDEWIVQSFIRLKKNSRFWDAKNVHLDEVIFYPIEDANSELNRFRAGELDSTHNTPSGQFKRLKKEFGKNFLIFPYLGIYYYPINMNDPKLKDIRVRKALSMALNREIITQKILGEGQQPAYTFVPPNINNYVSPKAQPKLEFSGWSPSKRIKEARKLMSQAGYSKSKPLKIQLKYNTSDEHKKIAVAISAMWKQIYVDTELFNQETKVHYENLQNNNFEVARAGWIGDYNDPTTFTDLFLENDYNYSRYRDKKSIDLAKKATKTLDLNKRAKILAQLERRVLDAYSVIPIYYYVSKTIIAKRVSGWKNNIVDTHRSRWVDLR